MSKLVFISGIFRVTYKRKRAGSGKTLFLAPSTGQKPAGPLSGLVGETMLLQRLAGLNLGSLTTEVSEDTETHAHTIDLYSH